MCNIGITSFSRAILTGGLIAGALDIADAIIVSWLRGGSPMRMLRYIASGVLGPSVVDAGVGMAALGLLFHFTIATGWAALYIAASGIFPVLWRRPFICGIAYGLIVWASMQYVVLPASLVRMGPGPQLGWPLVNMLAIHAFGVGLPIALVARRLRTPGLKTQGSIPKSEPRVFRPGIQ